MSAGIVRQAPLGWQVKARADVPVTDRKTRSTGKSGHLIGYPFEPLPTVALDLALAKKIDGDDLVVLSVLIRYQSSIAGSCWTTIPRLVKEVGSSESTVRRSLRRLKAAELIAHIEIGRNGDPDPLEPRNKVGWRFYFLWVQSPPGVSDLTPTRCQKRHPPGVRSDTQSKMQGNPLPSGERYNQTDDDRLTPVVSASSSLESPHEEIREAGQRTVREAIKPQPDPHAVPPVGELHVADAADDEDEDYDPWCDVLMELSKLTTKPATALQKIRKTFPDASVVVVMFSLVDTIKTRASGKIKTAWFPYLKGVIENRLAEGEPVPIAKTKPTPPPAARPAAPAPAPPPRETPEQAAARDAEKQRLLQAAEAARRRKQAAGLISAIGTNFWTIAEVDGAFDLVDAFPAYPSEEEERRMRLSKLTRAIHRPAHVAKLNALRLEVEELLGVATLT